MKHSRSSTPWFSVLRNFPLAGGKPVHQQSSWSSVGLWLVFLPLSGAIAIFWKPITHPEAIHQITRNVSTNLQTLLSPLTPHFQALRENLKETWESAQTLDPAQPSLEVTEPFPSPLSLTDEILREAQVAHSDRTQSETLVGTNGIRPSLAEIDQELRLYTSLPSLSQSFPSSGGARGGSGVVSPSNPRKKTKSKDKPSVHHPLLSSLPSQSTAQKSTSVFFPSSGGAGVVTSVSASLSTSTREEKDSISAQFPIYSSVAPPLLPPAPASNPLESSLQTYSLFGKSNQDTKTPNWATTTSRTTGVHSDRTQSERLSPTSGYGSSRLYPFAVPPSPVPTPSFSDRTQSETSSRIGASAAIPSASIRPRGYGVMKESSNLSAPPSGLSATGASPSPYPYSFYRHDQQ